jgi:carbon monoxide dehydrogenase subunit G
MKLEGEHKFGASRADVWRALQDPQMLAHSLPGVRQFEADGEDRYKLTVAVGVGAVKGAYAGVLSLRDKREPESCQIVAEASGPPGSISTTAQMRLADLDDGGTLLAYAADSAVTGPLAGVGQRMIEAAARKTTRDFLLALDRRLSAGGAGSAPAESGADRAERPAAAGERRSFTPTPAARSEDRNLKLFAGGLLTGFAMAMLGVLVGRRTANG